MERERGGGGGGGPLPLLRRGWLARRGAWHDLAENNRNNDNIIES